MKKPTTISKESVSEYREFVQLRLRKRVLEAIEVVLEEEVNQAPAVVRSLEEAGNQLLTFYEFPRAMWKSIRTTNALENLNREFRRRTKTKRRSPARSPRSLCCLGLSPLARFNYDASTATNL